jgi:hypothetical protein
MKGNVRMQAGTLVTVRADGRKQANGDYGLANPDSTRVVGVREPRNFRRDKVAREHAISPANAPRDWREIAGQLLRKGDGT